MPPVDQRTCLRCRLLLGLGCGPVPSRDSRARACFWGRESASMSDDVALLGEVARTARTVRVTARVTAQRARHSSVDRQWPAERNFILCMPHSGAALAAVRRTVAAASTRAVGSTVREPRSRTRAGRRGVDPYCDAPANASTSICTEIPWARGLKNWFFAMCLSPLTAAEVPRLSIVGGTVRSRVRARDGSADAPPARRRRCPEPSAQR